VTPADLKSWRTRLGLSQREAAGLLGITPGWYGQMESGFRRTTGEPIEIPKTVAYSCAWIALHGAGDPFPDA
jgi:transcriptional regulator with XRE-family HTH domain